MAKKKTSKTTRKPRRPKTESVSDAELVKAYREVFGDDRGQTVLRDLMDECAFFSDGFDPDRPDLTQYNAGKRGMIIHILDKLTFPKDPDAVLEQIERFNDEAGFTEDERD